MFRAAFYRICKILKQPGYLSLNEWVHNAFYSEIKKKGITEIYNMDDLKNVILNQGRLTRVYAT